ncbi:MAG TPA: copper chaperone [Aeromonadales bacterium]|nr:copper chaperone [Aeromonadales bacterium]
MKNNLITTILITAVIIFFSQSVFSAEKHYQLKVNGLVCPFCEYNIEKKLSKLDGVLKVKANLKEGLVNILVAEGKTLPEDAVRQQITDAGFTLKGIDEHEPGKIKTHSENK